MNLSGRSIEWCWSHLNFFFFHLKNMWPTPERTWEKQLWGTRENSTKKSGSYVRELISLSIDQSVRWLPLLHHYITGLLLVLMLILLLLLMIFLQSAQLLSSPYLFCNNYRILKYFIRIFHYTPSLWTASEGLWIAK